MDVKTDKSNTVVFKYDRMYEKDKVQNALDAFHMSGYSTDVTLFSIDGTEYMMVEWR